MHELNSNLKYLLVNFECIRLKFITVKASGQNYLQNLRNIRNELYEFGIKSQR